MGFFEAIFKIGFGVAFGLLVYDTFLPMLSFFWQTVPSIGIKLGVQVPEEPIYKLVFYGFNLCIFSGLLFAIPTFVYLALERVFELGEEAGNYAFAVYLYLVWVIIYQVMIS